MIHSKIRPIVIAVAVCLLLVPPSLSSFSNFQESNPMLTPNEDSSVSLAYSSHYPVVISRNSDFLSQGWSGRGTSYSPYTISSLNITSESVVCILITDTTSYFTIRDCWLSSEESAWGQGIITLSNVINGRIENNVFASGHTAISVEDSSSCTFTMNTIGTSQRGFLAYNLHDSEFSENIQVSPSMVYPVHIEDSTNVDITDNFFEDCLYEGIRLISCTNCFISFNTLSGADLHNGLYGLALRNSRDCTLKQNNLTAFGTAIDITEGQRLTISDNYIDWSWRGIMLRGNDTTISNNEIDVTGFCIQLRESFGSIVDSN
ncbi:MAG: right-handed parallel beta-helix repeat-containing protein, partial [Candidatus Thorarchaeota archaeon]